MEESALYPDRDADRAFGPDNAHRQLSLATRPHHRIPRRADAANRLAKRYPTACLPAFRYLGVRRWTAAVTIQTPKSRENINRT